jgi:hypothetical protein
VIGRVMRSNSADASGEKALQTARDRAAQPLQRGGNGKTDGMVRPLPRLQ